jgi:hypothetical protein
MKRILACVAAFSTVSLAGCTSSRSTGIIEDLQKEIRETQYDQVKKQLAYTWDHPYDVPSLVFVGTATVTATNNATLTYSRAKAPTGLSQTSGLTFGAFTNTSVLGAAVNSSPFAITGMRDLYAYAIFDDRTWQSTVGKFLVNRPPAFPWVYRSKGPSIPPGCPEATCYKFLVDHGYTYWANTPKSYSDFTLAVLEAGSYTATSSATVTTSAPVAKTPPKSSNLGPVLKIVPFSIEKGKLAPNTNTLILQQNQ